MPHRTRRYPASAETDRLLRAGATLLRRMRRDATLLKEETLDGREQVVWELLADGRHEIVALRFQDAGIGPDCDDQRRGYLLVVGTISVCARSLAATQRADSLAILIELKEPERAQLIELLDFEISFGTRTADNSPGSFSIRLSPPRGPALMNNITLQEIVSRRDKVHVECVGVVNTFTLLVAGRAPAGAIKKLAKRA